LTEIDLRDFLNFYEKDFIMQAKLRKEGEITVVTIQGFLEIEQTQPFREACAKHLINEKVVFNMEKTNFVGSTGLQPFLDTVQNFLEKNEFGLKVVCKRPEFIRIFQNYQSNKLRVVDSEDKAILAFQEPIYDVPTNETPTVSVENSDLSLEAEDDFETVAIASIEQG
jgi:anti-anti-sigma factor